MGKTVWYISKYAVTPEFGNPTRQYFLSKYLSRIGYNVSLVYSRSSIMNIQPLKINIPYLTNLENFNQIMLPGPLISIGLNLKRVWSWLFFEWQVKKWTKKQRDKPEIVIVSSLSILTFLTGIWLKRRFDCQLIVEVRDIYPYTLTAMGKFSRNNPAVMYLSWLEKRAYEEANLIVSTLDNFEKHLKENYQPGNNKYLFLPMGYDPEYFQEEDVEIKIPRKNKFIVGYFGSFGQTQATSVIFRAIKALKNNDEIHFLLAGDGIEKVKGLDLIKNQNNFTDYGVIPKTDVPNLIKQCDVVLNPWLNLEIYKFGISPNKWMDYMFAGVPIIICYAGASKLISEARCGSIIQPENTTALVNEILRFKNMCPKERKKLGDNGKKFLTKYLDYSIHAAKLAKSIESNIKQ